MKNRNQFGDREYITIEGGLGWWNDTRFATEPPKFIMGGVSNNFLEWANGLGAWPTKPLSLIVLWQMLGYK